MRAAKVIGRVVATKKYPTLKGKKILLLRPMKWRDVRDILSGGKNDDPKESFKSVVALDSVGAGWGEYVFYVSSREACHSFKDFPVCDNAVVGIIDGIFIKENKNVCS